MAELSLLRLLTWLSPAFPTGGFAYSHGLEWAVEAGAVRDEASLTAWMEDTLRLGALWSDAILLRLAHRGEDVAALGMALAPQRSGGWRAARRGQPSRSPPPPGRAWTGRTSPCPMPSRSENSPRRMAWPRTTPLWPSFTPPAPTSSPPPSASSRSASLPVCACRRVWSLLFLKSRAAAPRRAQKIWAGRAGLPTSPPCGMKHNIRGYSGHDFKMDLCASALAAPSAPAKQR